MRSSLGKPTRDLFLTRLKEAAPGFFRSSSHDVPGYTWTLLRQQGPLREWLVYERHRYHNAFTVELAWSRTLDNPARVPLGRPKDAFTPEGRRFRVSVFFTPEPEFWWYVDAPAAPRAPVGAVAPAVQTAVDEAIARIREHALPYLDRVARWSETAPG